MDNLPSTGDVLVAPTFQDTIAADRAEEARPKASLMDAWKASVDQDWLSSAVINHYGTPSFAPDEGFRWTPDAYKAATKDIPTEYWGQLDDARSEAEAKHIESRLRIALDNERKLADQGFTGVGLRVLNSIADPAMLALTVATGGAAGVAAGAMGVSRVARAALIGSTALTTATGATAYMVNQNPVGDWMDVVYVGAFGAGLGAYGIKGALAAQRTEAALKLAEQMRLAKANELGVPVPGAKLSLLPEPEAPIALEPAPAPKPAQSAGAAATPANAPAYTGPAKTAFADARIDMAGKTMGDEIDDVRRLAGWLGVDAVGKVGGAVSDQGAPVIQQRIFRTTLVDWSRTANPEYESWAKSQNMNWYQRQTSRGQFMEEVNAAIIRDPGTYTADPHVNKAADKMRKLYSDVLAQAKEAGVKGFDDIDPNSNYRMRVLAYGRISQLISRLGPDGEEKLANVLGNSLWRNMQNSLSAGMSPEDLKRLQRAAMTTGKAWLKSVRNRQMGNDVATTAVFSVDRVEMLAGMVRTELGGVIPDDQIDDIVDALAGKMRKGGDGNPSRAKMRTTFDETYEQTVKDAAGNDVNIKLEDLFERNAEATFAHYTRQMSGMIALAKNGLDSQGAFDKQMQSIREQVMAAGRDPKTDANVRRLEMMHKAVLGIPLSDVDSEFSTFLRRVRDLNFTRLMNLTGFAQLTEFAQAITHIGFNGITKYVPEVLSVVKRAKDGTLSNKFIDEIETYWGIGSDRYLNSILMEYDGQGLREMRTTSTVDKVLHNARTVTLNVSAQLPMTVFQRRLAAAGAIHTFASYAERIKAGGDLPKGFVKRMAAIGIDEYDMKAIANEIATHTDWKPGITGKKVKALNLGNWQNGFARDRFLNGIMEWTNRAIQENDASNLAMWMTSDLGKTLAQFRVFSLVAYSRQTLAMMHYRDMQMFAGFTASLLMGALSYTARQHVTSIGRDDRQEYLEKRLSPQKIATAAFNNSAWSSLAPMGADTVAWMAGYDPIFNHARNSQISGAGLILGNPTVDLAVNAGNAVKGIVAPPLNGDYDFSKADARSLFGMLFFSNAIGVSNAFNYAIGAHGLNLPDKSK